VITSPHNATLKELKRIARRKDTRFLAEGEDLVQAAEEAGWTPSMRLEAGVDVDPEVLQKASSLAQGSRVIAVYEERWSPPVGPVCVCLWGVRDPGNVGTVLRSAHAFGAGSVALGPGTADPFGTKAVRASMGAVFRVPIARVTSLDELPGPRVALAAREGEVLRGPREGTIVVGAERAGLPEEVLVASDERAHIPIRGESLNAAMAATVALYEWTTVRAA
jgi:TrmH family RNA methyltransferase